MSAPPAMPRRQLGRYLRNLRLEQRLTVRTAAERLEWSEAKIWRIETGQVSLRSLDVEAMCRIYGASADLTEALMGLAKETKARGWWQVVLNEAILRRPIGRTEVIRSQLRRLLEVGDLPNVSVRTMPFDAGLHPGVMSGPFVILRFPVNGDGRETEPPTTSTNKARSSDTTGRSRACGARR